MYYDNEREEHWERERREYERIESVKAAEIRRLHGVCATYQEQAEQVIKLLTQMEEILSYIPNYKDVPKDLLTGLCQQAKAILST